MLKRRTDKTKTDNNEEEILKVAKHKPADSSEMWLLGNNISDKEVRAIRQLDYA